MKTPQEEAEEMIGKLTSAMIPMHKNQTENPYFVLREREYLASAIKTFAPIAELIAVARAAASDKKDEECTCGTDPERSCRYCGYFIRLDRALQALRATGRVEL